MYILFFRWEWSLCHIFILFYYFKNFNPICLNIIYIILYPVILPMFTDIFHTFDIYLSVSLHKCYIFPMVFCVINNFGLSFLIIHLMYFQYLTTFKGQEDKKNAWRNPKWETLLSFHIKVLGCSLLLMDTIIRYNRNNESQHQRL